MSYFEIIILAIIEGLTEFLPISSSAHMRLADTLFFRSGDNEFVKFFLIGIQLGAILAVVALYYQKFFGSIRFYWKLSLAVIPVVVVGYLLHDLVDQVLDNIFIMAIFLIIGGVVLLYADKKFSNNQIDKEEDVSIKKAVLIGCSQCIALFPGVSRSAASIVGGLSLNLTRRHAAEFSFFLAVPTMVAALTYKAFKYMRVHDGIANHEVISLVLGNIIAFIVGVFVLKTFLNFIDRYGFAVFAWYRIFFGSFIFCLAYFHKI